MLKTTMIAVLLAAAASIPADAKELYVNAVTGNDATSYANNGPSSPWRTIGRAAWGSASRGTPNAAEAARAGDVVIVAAGTYSTTGTGNRIDPAYNPVNTGTAGAPIEFRADGLVVLTQSGTGPVVGANGNNGARNYIYWRGFRINEINAMSTSDTGPVVLWSTTGSRIEDFVIDGNDNGVNGNNHNGIRLENVHDVVIRNNRIYNVLNFGSRQMNGAGIMAYFSDGAIIENNEIFNCGAAVFVKGGDNINFRIRYNYVHDNAYGVLVQYTGASGEHRISQNVARANEIGISVRLRAYNVRVVNNTVVDNGNGIQVIHWQEPIGNIEVVNNIVRSNSEAINGGEATAVAQFSLDRNVYVGSLRWSMNGALHTSVGAWRTALGNCPGTGNECASITADPQFQNSGAGDYRLQPSSPARNVGIDVLDADQDGNTTELIPAGAYVTGNERIGISGQLTTLPSAPTGLRIVPGF